MSPFGGRTPLWRDWTRRRYVPLALYCVQSIAIDRLEVVLALAQAVSIGGDTDTIASIAGQLAGTFLGRDGVPRVLFSDIQGRRRGCFHRSRFR